MIEEAFANGESVMHRIDPRLRIVFATILSFVIALSYQFAALIAALVFSVILICMARLNFSKIVKKLVLLWYFILFIWLILPLTFKGEPLFCFGPLTVTRPGIVVSMQITLKSNAILLSYIAMIITMNMAAFGQALGCLKVPQKFIHLFLLTYRYIFVIDQEYQRLIRAARIRGFCPGTNLHTYKTYAYIAGMLLVKASERAKRVHQAMLCRGFRGKFYSLSEFSIHYRDWAWSVFMSFAIIGLVYLEWAGKNGY